jgi:catechol 2,3-dioxygenase-like lactoylglutathione lyase family enzyme
VSQKIAAVTLLVHDYDEAIAWFTARLGFRLVADTPLGGTKRWVLVEPRGGGAQLLLARAEGPAQQAAVGRAAGGRGGFFLHTDDFAGDHAAMAKAGVVFREAPRQEAYGTVAVFEDLYGNGWDLIESRRS